VGTEYKIFPEVSLARICEQVNNLEYELRRFLFSSSSVDALILDSDYNPCLVVEFQSSYHDSAEAKERDRKKATLLKLAGVPLIYSRIYNVKLLHLYSEDEAIIHNLFTGEGREDAEAFVRSKNVNYPTLIDDALLIGFKGSLPANAIPSTIVIDRKGYVAARVSGVVTIGSLSALIEKVQGR
jgi:hypothetical protein